MNLDLRFAFLKKALFVCFRAKDSSSLKGRTKYIEQRAQVVRVLLQLELLETI